MKKLRVAIIGCGRISVSYADAFHKLGDLMDVVACCDKVKEKADKYAEQFHCLSLTDYRDLFKISVDVVHLCLPHYLHAPIAIDCLNHGINVLTEKPMALSLQEADEMIYASQRNHKLLGCIFQTRYNESVQILKKMLDEGDFGKVKSASSWLLWERNHDYYASSDWKGTWEKEGGGVLIDQAIHSLDRVRYLMGSDVEWVEASWKNETHPYIKVEDLCEALIHFKNGVDYHLWASDSGKGNPPIHIDFECEKGKFGLRQDIGYSEIDGVKKEYREINERASVGEGYWGTTHVMQLKEFYLALLNHTPILVTAEEGRKTLELVKGIYQSCLQKKRIYFPFEDSYIYGLEQK